MGNDGDLRAAAMANPIENFRYGFDRKFEPIVLDRYQSNTELFDRLLGDPSFAAMVKATLVQEVFERIRRSAQQPKG